MANVAKGADAGAATAAGEEAMAWTRKNRPGYLTDSFEEPFKIFAVTGTVKALADDYVKVCRSTSLAAKCLTTEGSRESPCIGGFKVSARSGQGIPAACYGCLRQV